MKAVASILTLIVTAASASLALAQGTVTFNNSSTSLVQVQVWESSTTYRFEPIPKGQGYVQLAYAPSGTNFVPWSFGQTASAWIASNPGWTLGLTTPIAPVDGRFNGGVITLIGVPAGANADYVILAWTGAQTSFD